MGKINNKQEKDVYCVESNDFIKIIQEVDYTDVKNISYFKTIKTQLEDLKTSKPKYLLSKVGHISNLRFYYVIDCKVLFDRQNYFKLFFDKKFKDMNDFKKEHKKYLDSLHKLKKTKKIPKIFDKLGETNELKGCYLIATINDNYLKIKTNNSSHTISIKLALDKLPPAIENICDKYYEYVEVDAKKEFDELKKFINMNQSEQDLLISDIVSNIGTTINNIMGDLVVEKNKNFIPDNYLYNKIRIEDVFMKGDLKEYTDIEFLQSIMEVGMTSENYELCNKIQKRISELQKKLK